MNVNCIIEKLENVQNKKIVVLGDYCLDKYIYSNPAEDDISVETGMKAWQIYDKKCAAGVAGTITNNLRALGAQVTCVGIVGDDGEGYELIKELKRIGAETEYVIVTDEIVTATYLKTMRLQANGQFKEDVRFDFRNRSITSETLFDKLVENLEKAVEGADGVIVSDQYYERNSGVVGDYVRDKVNELAKKYDIPFLVDSRAFASEFQNMFVKCNNYELMKYCGAKGDPENRQDVLAGGFEMKEKMNRPVFITCNKDGIIIFDEEISTVPAYPVEGEIDVTGAGDASNAGIIIGLSLGLKPQQAAMIACAVSSITIQQLGTTGTATIPQVIERLEAIAEMMK
ncbi:MAG: carbohydrate kinase [Clostridia bacterium]|nr:carbohydrate kinase [Clostridia bacterium]